MVYNTVTKSYEPKYNSKVMNKSMTVDEKLENLYTNIIDVNNLVVNYCVPILILNLIILTVVLVS